MKSMNITEMTQVNGGATYYCECGRSFGDTKFLWWTLKTGKSKLEKHQKTCWVYKDKAGYNQTKAYFN